MNTFVYTLQCLLVFGVPPLFGWVLLRRAFREAGWLTLLPGAVVVGLAALMATVNELRFFWEMRIAVWSAYKLLLAATLALLVMRARPVPTPRLPSCLDRAWKLALLVAATAGVTVYFGIPAFNGYLNDAWWFHYPTAVQIQTIERFPLSYVFAPDDPLYYHYGPDILTACWSFLLERPVQTASALNIVILAPCAFLLAFSLGTRLSRNYWGSLLGASLLIAGGNLRWLLFFTGKYGGDLGALRVFNSQTVQTMLQLTFTPSQILGVPMVLVALLLFRHLLTRPSWPAAGGLGLVIGALTLVAEWYFLPLVAGITLVLIGSLWRQREFLPRRRLRERAAIALLPLCVTFAWGSFNNTYISGIFGHFWMRYGSVNDAVVTREFMTKLATGAGDLPRSIQHPAWQVPNLVPLHLNLVHLGQVPSWEASASSEASSIPMWSPAFLMEISPVLLCGIPFGLWLAWRRRTPFLLLLAGLAATATLPPVFLEWGFRSTDFLRFFTAAYCYAALFIGWLAGELLASAAASRRMLGGALAAACLVNPIGLGVVGLLPGTLGKAKAISSGAHSLSQFAGPDAKDAIPVVDPAGRQEAFERLAATAGDFLFPLTQGRDRAIVIVPPDQLPPELHYFPEWMKTATLARVVLPIGWYWNDSLYATYYRAAVVDLDPTSLRALDVRWIIVSNCLLPETPPPVAAALRDSARFTSVATFREGGYSLTVFQVRP